MKDQQYKEICEKLSEVQYETRKLNQTICRLLVGHDYQIGGTLTVNGKAVKFKRCVNCDHVAI